MKSLHRRLTFLYTITTGLILTLTIAGFFVFRVRENRQAQLESFHSVWNSLSLRTQSETVISHSFLSQTEAQYQMIIHIEENGTPLLYSGSWTPPTDRRALIGRAKELSAAQGVSMSVRPISSLSNQSSLLSFSGDHGDQYYAMILALATEKGVKSLCAILYRPSVWETLKSTILFLCLMDVCGILLLFFISWHFVAWSLRPVEESRKKQAEFIAAASHELRSPLAVLRSGLSAMEPVTEPATEPATEPITEPATAHSPEDQRALLSLLDQECARMSRLIGDMLLLASADARTWSLHMQTVDMDTLLIDTYETYLPACRKRKVTLDLKLPENTFPPIQADPERIRQVLFILLDNALTYTPEDKKITLAARITGDPSSKSNVSCLSLSVTDQGCGIPDTIKPLIFDRFYQADPSRSDKSHFGLGLSIAKELVSLHKGTISVSDGGPGEGTGTCFTVTLPCSSAAIPDGFKRHRLFGRFSIPSNNRR